MIAMEYASSPVEQAGIQTRIGSLGSLLLIIFGMIHFLKYSNESASLKKAVTLIRRS